jgi:hypothetical protein
LELTPAALIGVAVDVSGSMQGSIRNRRGTSGSRFESLQEALVEVVRASRQRAEEIARSGLSSSTEALVFAYAFGLSTSLEVVDLLAFLAAAKNVTTPAEIEQLKQRYSDEVRQRYAGYAGLGSLARSYGFGDLVDQYSVNARASAEQEVRARIKQEIIGRLQKRLATQSTVTTTLTELARQWSTGSTSFDNAEQFIFGATPMRECLEQMADRFAVEARKLATGAHKFLLLVSDGEPTDGDPHPALARIRSQGVFVASCLVTDDDVTEPRRLYGEPCAEWNRAARLMFEAASTVEDDDAYRELLEARGWLVAEKSRLFIQINQSEMIDEFLALTFDRALGGHSPG